MAPRKRKAESTAKDKSKSSEARENIDGERHDLYAVLGVEKGASHEEIRKAYHRMALRLHPDKNPGDESAKEKFQSLQRIFSILGDPEKRRVYDETGSTGEDAMIGADQVDSLYEYYRTIFKEVTVDVIERFEEEYRGSDEEAKDLKECYARFNGNMQLVFEWMMCSRPALDSHRFRDLLQAAVASGELKSYKSFKKWAAEVDKLPVPKEPLKPKKRMKSPKKSQESGGGEVGLTALIRKRQEVRSEALLSVLERKYAGGERKLPAARDRGAALPKEPTEEEFQAARERVLRKRAKK